MAAFFETPTILLPKRRRTLGLTSRAWLTLGCVSGAILVFYFAVQGYQELMLRKDADHLFTRVLGSGDLRVLHQGADLRFQAAYPWDLFEPLAQQQAHLFVRDQIQPQDLVWLEGDGDLYVVLRAQVQGAHVQYVTRPTEHGGYRLVGVAPGFDAAVPRTLKPIK